MNSLPLGLDSLDLGFIILLIVCTFIGFQRGLVWVGLSLAGLYIGLLSASFFAPGIAQKINLGGSDKATAAIIIFVILVFVIYLMIAGLGYRLHLLTKRSIFAEADKWLGSVLALLGMTVVIWFLGQVFVTTPYSGLNDEIKHSKVLARIDSVAPKRPAFLDAIVNLLSSTHVTTPFGDISLQLDAPLPIPGPEVAKTAAIQVDSAGVVKVEVTGCAGSVALTSTGFVYAPNYILTTAHTIGGQKNVQVITSTNAQPVTASVVAFDPKEDFAVLYVPNLNVKPLALNHDLAGRGTLGAVIGYPEGTQQVTSPMVVRGTQLVQGNDIYQQGGASREITLAEGRVQTGDSGAPLVDQQGQVVGMVFYGGASGLEAYSDNISTIVQTLTDISHKTTPVATGNCVNYATK